MSHVPDIPARDDGSYAADARTPGPAPVQREARREIEMESFRVATRIQNLVWWALYGAEHGKAVTK